MTRAERVPPYRAALKRASMKKYLARCLRAIASRLDPIPAPVQFYGNTFTDSAAAGITHYRLFSDAPS